jgi:hypothetical protein
LSYYNDVLSAIVKLLSYTFANAQCNKPVDEKTYTENLKGRKIEVNMNGIDKVQEIILHGYDEYQCKAKAEKDIGTYSAAEH